MKWFKHDSNSNRDSKLEKVLMRYGADGYALYWLCLELIAEPIEKFKISFELEHDAEILAFRLKIDTRRVEEIMKYMIKLELFEHDATSERITCLKLASRIENSIVKSPQLKEIQDSIKESGIIPDDPGQLRISQDDPGQSGKIRARRDRDKKRKDTENSGREKSTKKESPPKTEPTKPIAKGWTPPKPNLPPQDFTEENTSGDIQAIIDHWNDQPELPHCRYQAFNIGAAATSDILARLRVFSLDEIKKTVTNLNDNYLREEKKFRPSTLKGFMSGNSFDRWTDEAKPWERYEESKTGKGKEKGKIKTEFEEVEY